VGCVAGADAMWSIPVPCARSTDIILPILTSQGFIDALTASTYGNLSCLASQISVLSSLIQFSIIHNTDTYTKHTRPFNRSDERHWTTAPYVRLKLLLEISTAAVYLYPSTSFLFNLTKVLFFEKVPFCYEKMPFENQNY
jgi:hypothetical protein